MRGSSLRSSSLSAELVPSTTVSRRTVELALVDGEVVNASLAVVDGAVVAVVRCGL